MKNSVARLPPSCMGKLPLNIQIKDIRSFEYFNPVLSFEEFNTRKPRAPLLCLSVRLPVTPADSGADEQRKTKFGPTYFVRLQYQICQGHLHQLVLPWGFYKKKPSEVPRLAAVIRAFLLYYYRRTNR